MTDSRGAAAARWIFSVRASIMIIWPSLAFNGIPVQNGSERSGVRVLKRLNSDGPFKREFGHKITIPWLVLCPGRAFQGNCCGCYRVLVDG